MALRSLRSRLVVGSLLWTAGVLAMAAAVATAVLLRFPHWANIAHNILFTVFAGVCVVAGLAQLRRGLSPFNQLRARLSAVRSGEARRVEGSYPSEVQPLVSDLNALLEERERRVTRALAQAGDLAHGLKTPLAVLAQEAVRAGAAGHAELATAIGEQVDRMRRQMDYQLVRARAAVSGATPGARCAVKESADALARALLKLHAGRGVRIDVQAELEHVVRARREDMDEMLGNLLDNACTWAKSRVTVASTAEGGVVTITVDDDGPGIPAEMLEAVLQRGVRADEAATGSGFGLAIVRDLAEVHGGSVVLVRAPGGGARARLLLPSAGA
jgi:signal transduction histidine kinase